MTNHAATAGSKCDGAISLEANCPQILWGIFTAILILMASPARAQDDNPQVHIVPVASFAQTEQPPAPGLEATRQEQQAATNDVKITVPAGTRFSLAVAQAISSKHTKPGDTVHLQFVFPVVVGSRMVIPPGTYVQGIVDEITRKDRRYEVLALKLRSANLIFSTGYTVSIPESVDIHPTYGALALPGSPYTTQPPVMAAAGTTTDFPVPHMPSFGKIIGITFGAVAAVAVVALVIHSNRDFYMEAGTPVEFAVNSPLVLEEGSVSAAIEQFSKVPPHIVRPARRMRTCWTTATDNYPSTPYPCPR
jgi:hypothetical protein